MNFKALFGLLFLSVNAVMGQQVSTEKRVINDTIHQDFINDSYAPIEFKIDVKEPYNSDFVAETYVVIPANSLKESVIRYPSIYSQDSTKLVTDYMDIKGNYGSPDTVLPDKNHLYLLPYPIGKRYHILQGYNGTFSHNLNHSRHAIDFELQIGDTITAARSGKVIYVKQDSKEHGPTREFIDLANKIIIMHDDGTFGHYVHLDFNQAFVEEGMDVEAGEAIGLSGMTGFTTKPHLHFVVMRERGQSIPVKFKNVKKQVPKQGNYYRRK